MNVHALLYRWPAKHDFMSSQEEAIHSITTTAVPWWEIRHFLIRSHFHFLIKRMGDHRVQNWCCFWTENGVGLKQPRDDQRKLVLLCQSSLNIHISEQDTLKSNILFGRLSHKKLYKLKCLSRPKLRWNKLKCWTRNLKRVLSKH